MSKIIFRDDDINFTTDLKRFKLIDELFIKYGVDHTIAVIANGLEKSPELIEYIKSHQHIKVQGHCWDHTDSTVKDPNKLREELGMARNKVIELFGVPPVIWYPPWNKVTQENIDVALGLVLQTSFIKVSTSQYVKVDGDVTEEAINFHYWADSDTMFLEPALQIYKKHYETN